MTDLLKKLSAALRATTTYRIGLLQAKAYRLLKARTSAALEPLGITTIEWAFLGLLYEAEGGIRAAGAAQELGVEPPFVTLLTSKLKQKKLVRAEPDLNDSRAKLLRLTKSGRAFVIRTEALVREAMRSVVHGIPPEDLMTYVRVLEAISRNCKD